MHSTVGRQFRLSKDVSQEVVESALTMAVQRFGRTLDITGTEAFRQQAVAAGAKLNVVFADPAMEQQRLALVVNIIPAYRLTTLLHATLPKEMRNATGASIYCPIAVMQKVTRENYLLPDYARLMVKALCCCKRQQKCLSCPLMAIYLTVVSA
jgi:hypothetical protein